MMDIKDRIRPIKLVILDVDGVLTDGRIVIDDNGQESKFFHVRDGHGIKLLLRTGIKAALLTGRQSHVVTHRADELGIDLVFQGVHDKLNVYTRLLGQLNLTDREVAFMGDDIVDLPVLGRVGLSIAPADAVEEVRETAHHVCHNRGGRGAVREAVELILKGQDRWLEIMTRYR